MPSIRACGGRWGRATLAKGPWLSSTGRAAGINRHDRDHRRRRIHRIEPRPPARTGGSAVARTFDDLARAVFAALGREPRIRYIDMPAELQRQYQNFTQADMSKLRGEGYSEPATPLEEGVRRSLAGDAALHNTEMLS